jgi:predicted PurR-regulated permease PerM
MSHSELINLADREGRDLSAKVRFALVSIILLPPLGSTLTTLGVPRPLAGLVVFAGLALLLVAFVVARVSERSRVPLKDYEIRKTAEIFARYSNGTATTRMEPFWEGQILRFAIRLAVRLAALFSNDPARIELPH